ncbi:MAG: thioredoxin-dependent thiol peroxidase [Bacteroidia bacterium]
MKKKAVKKVKVISRKSKVKNLKPKKTAKKNVTVRKKPVKKVVVKKPAGTTTDKVVNPDTFKPHVTSLHAGDIAPYFEGQDQDGNRISLNDFEGKTLVLYFYPKDDTPGCTAQSCSLRDEYTYLMQSNHAVLGVSADDVKSHKRFAEKFSLPFPLLADVNMDAIRAYDVWGQKMLFGRVYDGIIRTTFIIKNRIIERIITQVDTEGHGKQVQVA